LQEKVLEARRQLLPADHPDTGDALASRFITRI
jgi:hypothetical protein